MNDQHIQKAASEMRIDSLIFFIEDSLNRIKSNQEANGYVQYQVKIIESMLSEIQERLCDADIEDLKPLIERLHEYFKSLHLSNHTHKFTFHFGK